MLPKAQEQGSSKIENRTPALLASSLGAQITLSHKSKYGYQGTNHIQFLNYAARDFNMKTIQSSKPIRFSMQDRKVEAKEISKSN